MKYDESDLQLDDAGFLEMLAGSFENVKIRPKAQTASEFANAAKGTQQFRNRAIRLRAIARRLREAKP